MSPLDGVDLTDPQTFMDTDMMEFWSSVRHEDPVGWHPLPDGGFWVVSRYADVYGLYRDQDNLTSAKGNVLDTLTRGGDPAGGSMLAVTDGERHRGVRKVMSRFFTPRRLAEVEASIAIRTDAVMNAAVDKGTVDFAADVSDHLPMQAICDLMGVPEEDRETLLEHSKRALSSDTADADALEATVARNSIVAYLVELVERRRSDPGDDIVSAMVALADDDGWASDEELALNCYSLVLGGDESTRMSTSEAAVEFANRPQDFERLTNAVDDPAAIRAAVEEIVRWCTPAMHVGRTARRDFALGGQRIGAGDVVTMWNLAANFDPDQFQQPDEFRIDRDPNDHVAFGQGGHFCVGAAMARMELRLVLQSLCRKVEKLEILDQPTRAFSNFLRGYTSVPMRLSPR